MLQAEQQGAARTMVLVFSASSNQSPQVRREAALRTNDLEDLVAGLAAELDAESDRRTFIERCRLGRGRN